MIEYEWWQIALQEMQWWQWIVLGAIIIQIVFGIYILIQVNERRRKRNIHKNKKYGF